MKFTTVFRLAVFFCLFASTLTLAYAEAYQLANSMAFYVAILALIVLAYFGDDRWLLPRGLANWVAGAIFFAWSAWFFLGLHWDDNDPIGSVLPRAGPLLGLLLLAKLFRPKHPVDYWLLQALGLVQILLASVLALRSRLDREGPFFSILLLAYVAGVVWSSILFNLYRDAESAKRPGGANVETTDPGPGFFLGWRTWGIGPALGWAFLAFVGGLVVFFAIPRPGQEVTANIPALMPGATRSEVGFNPGADLNNTGPISISDAEVMKVEAFDPLGRKVRLDPDNLRFRGSTCSEYANGRWRPYTPMIQPRQVFGPESTPPPSEYLQITYNVDATKLTGSNWVDPYDASRQQALFLMEPIYLNPRTRAPIAYAERTGARANVQFHYRIDEPNLTGTIPRRTRRLVYHQFNAMPKGGTPAEEWSDEVTIQSFLVASDAAPPGRLTWWQVIQQTLPPDRGEELALLRKKAEEILAKAKVPALDREREDRLTPAQRRQLAIDRAKALERYLALAPEYAYALEHVRQDREVDPTVDFLCNVKQGHCELFASALALMLRTQGVPARVVIGFRGADWNSVGDWYEVRQYNAHAWVEAFIENEPPRSRQRNLQRPMREFNESNLPRGRWLTLDPSPAGGTAGSANPARSGSVKDFLHFVQFLWEFFILDYSGDLQREKLMERMRELHVDDAYRFWRDLFAVAPRGLLVAGGVGAAAGMGFAVWLVARLRRRRRNAAFYDLAARFPFYARFLLLAQRLGVRGGPAQTAAELGQEVTSCLQRRPGLDDVAHLPAAVAEAFYELRYGGRPLDAERAQALDRDVRRLEEAVAKNGKPTT